MIFAVIGEDHLALLCKYSSAQQKGQGAGVPFIMAKPSLLSCVEAATLFQRIYDFEKDLKHSDFLPFLGSLVILGSHGDGISDDSWKS